MICRLSILGLAFAVMAVTPLHAQGVKEPGTMRCEAPGAKVIVKEGRGVRQVMTP